MVAARFQAHPTIPTCASAVMRAAICPHIPPKIRTMSDPVRIDIIPNSRVIAVMPATCPAPRPNPTMRHSRLAVTANPTSVTTTVSSVALVWIRPLPRMVAPKSTPAAMSTAYIGARVRVLVSVWDWAVGSARWISPIFAWVFLAMVSIRAEPVLKSSTLFRAVSRSVVAFPRPALRSCAPLVAV